MPVKKPPEKKTGKKAKRATPQLYDSIFKKLMHLSNKAVVSFINGLFGKTYPSDSKVEYQPTETVTKRLRRRLSDTRLKINGDGYHVEAQINRDAGMMIRVFEYNFNDGITKKTFEGGIRTIEFYQARVINFTGTALAPEEQTLRLRFSKKSYYDYVVENFNLLAHSVKQLEKKGLAILLPFYVLKLRERVKKAASGAERRKLSVPMKKLLDNLEEAVKNCGRKGQIDGEDAFDLMECLERLHSELYGKYKEFAQENSMLKEKIVRPSALIKAQGKREGRLEVAKNFLSDGLSPERVARNTGLPLAEVKALLKTAKVKQPA
jgi:predicted transposase/invertase (TIGR01784 family)